MLRDKRDLQRIHSFLEATEKRIVFGALLGAVLLTIGAIGVAALLSGDGGGQNTSRYKYVGGGQYMDSATGRIVGEGEQTAPEQTYPEQSADDFLRYASSCDELDKVYRLGRQLGDSRAAAYEFTLGMAAGSYPTYSPEAIRKAMSKCGIRQR